MNQFTVKPFNYFETRYAFQAHLQLNLLTILKAGHAFQAHGSGTRWVHNLLAPRPRRAIGKVGVDEPRLVPVT